MIVNLYFYYSLMRLRREGGGKSVGVDALIGLGKFAVKHMT